MNPEKNWISQDLVGKEVLKENFVQKLATVFSSAEEEKV